MTPEQRFEAQVERTETCWLWQGSLSAGRYASFMVDGRQTRVHRWAYERENGPIPPGYEIDHICGITRCVRPDHLRAVTPSENVRAHWREQRGVCRNGHSMTDDNVVWRLRGTQRKCRTCERARRRRYRAKN